MSRLLLCLAFCRHLQATPAPGFTSGTDAKGTPYEQLILPQAAASAPEATEVLPFAAGEATEPAVSSSGPAEPPQQPRAVWGVTCAAARQEMYTNKYLLIAWRREKSSIDPLASIADCKEFPSARNTVA